jgi:hypothetical protein
MNLCNSGQDRLQSSVSYPLLLPYKYILLLFLNRILTVSKVFPMRDALTAPSPPELALTS